MKKKIIFILCTLFVFLVPSYSQVFLLEEDMNERNTATAEEFNMDLPPHAITDDYTTYVPVGEGFLLLTGMGLAYGIWRRKKS